jgi:hypothetical protein
MFDTWLWGLDKDEKPLVLAGVAATCWVIWHCRNDVVFDQKIMTPFVGYLFSYTLALYMDYFVEAWSTGYGLSYLPTFGASTTRMFFPGSWVAV